MPALTHQLALPQPSHIHEIDETQVDQSEWQTGALHTKLMAAGVHPKLWRLEWRTVPLETASGVFLHWDHFAAGQHGGRQFAITLPHSGQIVIVIWVGTLQITNVSARFRNVEGTVALAIANDFVTTPEFPDSIVTEGGDPVVTEGGDPVVGPFDPLGVGG